jgi:hypothetical protein
MMQSLVASVSGSIGRADLARDVVPIGLEEVEDGYSNIKGQLMKSDMLVRSRGLSTSSPLSRFCFWV